MDTKPRTPTDEPEVSLALRDPSPVVADLLELACVAAGADRAALLLIEDDGTLACRALHGRSRREYPRPAPINGLVREALEGDGPVLVSTAGRADLPDAWQETLGTRGIVLAPLTTPAGPLGVLALGFDGRDADATARKAASTAAASVARVLDGALTAQVERSRAIRREAALDGGREPAGRALAAIYMRAGLLRLVLDDELAAEAAEIERLAQTGLAALRRSEEALAGAGSLSDELFDALVRITAP